MDKVEILQNSDAGFSVAVTFENWRVGVVNYSKKIDIVAKPLKLEKHLLTDEVFFLGYGRGVLYIGEELQPVKMEMGKIYNVKKGIWHAILIDKNTRVFVVENNGTGPDNTEYKKL